MFEILQRPSADHDEARWRALRRPPRHCDEALTGTARRWLRQLPPRRRPQQLCERFPHVANRLAWCWSDGIVLGQVFDDVLTDRRGGRQGFPPPVVRELQRLRDFRAGDGPDPTAAGGAGAECVGARPGRGALAGDPEPWRLAPTQPPRPTSP